MLARVFVRGGGRLSTSLSSLSSSTASIPSLASQKFAHPKSIEGHVNCKDGDEFKSELFKWFNNVFIFSMNDEVVHTGYFKMSHYLIAICCQPKIS